MVVAATTLRVPVLSGVLPVQQSYDTRRVHWLRKYQLKRPVSVFGSMPLVSLLCALTHRSHATASLRWGNVYIEIADRRLDFVDLSAQSLAQQVPLISGVGLSDHAPDADHAPEAGLFTEN